MSTRVQSGPSLLALLAALLLSCVFSWRQAQAHAGPEVDIDVFYHALKPYGHWVHHDSYGRVWYPYGIHRGWRPYTYGHWAHTLEYGWVWVSEWVWGWAPFHYGRWAWDDWYGWFWVPGRLWAPAWVFWRHGGGYAAWAPMPPHVIWRPGSGLNTHYFDFDRDLDSDCWVAVREHDLARRHIGRHIIEPRQTTRIIQSTLPIFPLASDRQTLINRGVPVERIERITRRPITPTRLRELKTIDHRANRWSDGVLRIIKPNIKQASPEEIRRDEERAASLASQREARRRTAQPSSLARPGVERFEYRLPGRLMENRFSPGQSPSSRPAQLNPPSLKAVPPQPQAPNSSPRDRGTPFTSGVPEPGTGSEVGPGIRQPATGKPRRSPPHPSALEPQPERPEVIAPPSRRAIPARQKRVTPIPKEIAPERSERGIPRAAEPARPNMDRPTYPRPLEPLRPQTEPIQRERKEPIQRRRWPQQETIDGQTMQHRRQIELEMQRQRIEHLQRTREDVLHQRQWQPQDRARPEQRLQGQTQRQYERARGQTPIQGQRMSPFQAPPGGRQPMDRRRP